MENDKPPQFPQYPNPNGLDVGPYGSHKPLMKMVKLMMKPPGKRDPFHARRPTTRKVKKQQRFY